MEGGAIYFSSFDVLLYMYFNDQSMYIKKYIELKNAWLGEN